MEKYLGVKLVDAEPQLRGYAMGLTSPNQAVSESTFNEEGYKVVHEDDYVSWSPKEVFEKSYAKVKVFDDIIHKDYIKDKYESLAPHQQRIVGEIVELEKKISSLDSFILKNPQYKVLDEEEQNRLIQQVRCMEYYFSILVERVNAWKLD